MGNAAVASGDGDVLQLNVHVVLSCDVSAKIQAFKTIEKKG
jgi:hypothetical protein